MARHSLVLLAVLTALFPFPAQAAHYSGAYLLYVCGSDEKGRELVPGGHIACQAYIAGVIDYHNLIHSLGTSPSVDFCVPDDIDLNVIQKKVVEYLSVNRDDHEQFVASPGVALALFANYPCGGKK